MTSSPLREARTVTESLKANSEIGLRILARMIARACLKAVSSEQSVAEIAAMDRTKVGNDGS